MVEGWKRVRLSPSLCVSPLYEHMYTCKRLCQAHANGMAAHSNEINYKNTQWNVDNEQYGRAYAIHLLIASHPIPIALLLRVYDQSISTSLLAVALKILCKCPI